MADYIDSKHDHLGKDAHIENGSVASEGELELQGVNMKKVIRKV